MAEGLLSWHLRVDREMRPFYVPDGLGLRMSPTFDVERIRYGPGMDSLWRHSLMVSASSTGVCSSSTNPVEVFLVMTTWMPAISSMCG